MDVWAGPWGKVSWRIDASDLWCWRRLLRVPWPDCEEIKPVNPKGNQSWIFIGRTDAEAEALILWPPDAKSWLPWKDLDAGNDWRQEEKGMTEDELVGWHHRLSGHEFEQILGEGQESLACCCSWSHKVGHNWVTEQQNIYIFIYTHILFNIILHRDSSQHVKYSSLCYTVGPCFLSVIYLL